jgi:hypothetical protein
MLPENSRLAALIHSSVSALVIDVAKFWQKGLSEVELELEKWTEMHLIQTQMGHQGIRVHVVLDARENL